MNQWTRRTIAGVAVTSCVLLLPAAPALAAAPHPAQMLTVVKTLASNFVGPLQFAVSGNRVVVADDFTSTLSLIGRPAPLATGPSPDTGGDLAGVAIGTDGRSLAYTTSSGDHSSTKLTILAAGKPPVVADLSGFEATANPDGKLMYGVDNPSECVANAFAKADIPVSYSGTVDSHPYAVAALANGAWAVADAGGNDVVKVDRSGKVSLIDVLPAQPVAISAGLAAGLGLDPCVVGVTYKFEAVPTDVETGPLGSLFVTTLPGGPEGPDSGNPGSVYVIDRPGHSVRVATGFVSATNLAIDPSGAIYVAELGAGRITKIGLAGRSTAIELPGVVAVEWANGHLYASTAPAAAGAGGPGTVVELGAGS